jgi:hypothetical protein
MQSRKSIRALVVPTTAIAFLLLAPYSAFAAKGASISLPTDFAAASTRHAFSGFSGFNRGNYTGAGYQGEFTRIESRLGVFDPLYVANKGKSSFTIEDSAGAVRLSAACGAIERTATVRFVTIDLTRLVYDCAFSGPDASPDFRFVLGEPKREGFKQKLLARDLRTGEAVVGGHSFVIDSVHEYQGSKLKSQTPLGYLLQSEGAAVAAVDLLDWSPVVHLRNDLSDSERDAVITVALALSVLRDPANSMLDD